MTTPKTNPSEHYKHFRKAIAFPFRKVDTAVSGRDHFQDFRPGFRFWHICHVDRHGHFTLKQLRLPVLNESHTNSYTGPRLFCVLVGLAVILDATLASMTAYRHNMTSFKSISVKDGYGCCSYRVVGINDRQISLL